VLIFYKVYLFLTSKEKSMKTLTYRFLIAITFLSVIMYGCSKTTDLSGSGNLQSGTITSAGSHVYGLIPMTPDQYSNVPLFSKETFPLKLIEKALLLADSLATPPIRDQGQIGSCTAFCGAETDEILQYYKKGGTGPWSNILSPAFVYYCERVLILKEKITADNGAYMVNIPQALQKYGDCLENSYSYPTSDRSTAYKTAPNSAALTEGLLYRIGQQPTSYGMISSSDLTTVKTMISNKIPVMMGFNVYDTSAYTLFEGLNTTKYVYNPLTNTGALVSGAKMLGGHAVPIVGYNDKMQAFLCQNSWGSSWGNHGFFYIPYTVFSSTRIVPSGNVYYATLN